MTHIVNQFLKYASQSQNNNENTIISFVPKIEKQRNGYGMYFIYNLIRGIFIKDHKQNMILRRKGELARAVVQILNISEAGQINIFGKNFIITNNNNNLIMQGTNSKLTIISLKTSIQGSIEYIVKNPTNDAKSFVKDIMLGIIKDGPKDAKSFVKDIMLDTIKFGPNDAKLFVKDIMLGIIKDGPNDAKSFVKDIMLGIIKDGPNDAKSFVKDIIIPGIIEMEGKLGKEFIQMVLNNIEEVKKAQEIIRRNIKLFLIKIKRTIPTDYGFQEFINNKYQFKRDTTNRKWYKMNGLKKHNEKDQGGYKKVEQKSIDTIILKNINTELTNRSKIKNIKYISSLLEKLKLNRFILAKPFSDNEWITQNAGKLLWDIVFIDKEYIGLSKFNPIINQLSIMHRNMAYHRDLKFENLTMKLNELYVIDCDGITSIGEENNIKGSMASIGTIDYAQEFVTTFIRKNLKSSSPDLKTLSAYMKFHDEYAMLIVLFEAYLNLEKKVSGVLYDLENEQKHFNSNNGICVFLNDTKAKKQLFEDFLGKCINKIHHDYITSMMLKPRLHIEDEIKKENKDRIFLDEIFLNNM